MKKLNILILMVVTLLVGCGKEKTTQEVEEIKKPVVTEVVQERELSNLYKTDSILVPTNKVNHQLEKGGTIEKILKKNGEKVKAGEVVMIFSDSNTESAYYTAKANYTSTEASMKIAKNNYEKYKKLYQEKLVSYLEYINYENAYINAKGAYESAKANYQNAKDDFEKLTRKADISGVVANLFGKVGNKVGSNETVFTVVDDEVMESYVSFPAEWLDDIEVGLGVKVEVPDVNKIFDGKITEINPVAEGDTKKFKIKVEVENSDKKIKDGMYAYTTVPAGKQLALSMNDEGIFVRNLLNYIYKVENGEVKKIEVKLGATNLPYTQVYSDELKAGDKVVIKGIFGLEDGDKVEEVEVK